MKIGIRQKLLSGFILIIFMFTVCCIIGLSILQKVVNTIERTRISPMVVIKASQDIKILIISIQGNMYKIILSGNTTEIDRHVTDIQRKENQAIRLLTIIQKQVLGNEGKLLALNTRILLYQYRNVRNKSIALAKSGNFNQAEFITNSEGTDKVKSLQFKLNQIGDYSSRKEKLLTEDLRKVSYHAKSTVIHTVLFCIVISLIITFSLSSSITRRLRSISTATTRMAKGDFHQFAEVKGHDELTLVASNFNIMAKVLAEMNKDLEGKVVFRTTELKETNDELNRIKNELEEKVGERTKDLEEKISELNRSQLAMLYMIEDMNDTSRKLKDTQDELIRKERLAILGEFSGNISHELRNPLGVIDSSIYYLQMRLNEKDEKIRQHLDRINNSVKSATTIIENLLNLTRMNKPDLLHYTLTELLVDCLKSCKIPETIKLMENYSESEILVKVEKEQIRMAVNNLVRNALSAMNGIGTLTIMTRETGDGEAEISFTDTGTGIDPEHYTKVFLPLFSTKAKGIGLGLSITKMIVENHNGKISVEGKPEMGAKFIIRLPVFRRTTA